MASSVVDNEEFLFRRICIGRSEYTYADGRLVFSASAFNDPGQAPSVDRSALRERPEEVRKDPSDGVTKIQTTEVRNCCNIPIDGPAAVQAGDDETKKAALELYAVDAIHRPIDADENGLGANDAHCQIECSPEIVVKSRFKKLKEALAVIATRHGFVVDPTGEAAGNG